MKSLKFITMKSLNRWRFVFCLVLSGLVLFHFVSPAQEVECERNHIDARVANDGWPSSRSFLEKLAEQKCIWSYFHLANRDKTADTSYIRNLLFQSASRGDERSLRRLGSFHSFGVGMKQDLVKAYALYRLAAYFGDKGTNFLAKKLSHNMKDEEVERAERLFDKWQADFEGDGKIDQGL